MAAADAGAAAHDANDWRSGGAANRMRAWPCPVFMTRRKIMTQTKIGNKTRPIKAKLRNASCLWDTHQRNLWVLDFIRRSPPPPWNIVQHDCGNINDQRRNHRPPQKCGLPPKTGSRSCRCSGPNQQHDFSAGEFSVVIRVRIIQVDPPGTEPSFFPVREKRTVVLNDVPSRIRSPWQIRLPITPFAPPAPRCSSCEFPASGIGRAQSIPREQRSGKSEQRRDYPSLGTPLW